MIRPYYHLSIYDKLDKRNIAIYLFAGFVITVSDFAAFTLLFSGLNAGLLVSTSLAYVVGLVVSYLLNRFWVFKKTADRQTGLTNIGRYGAFLLINLAITYVMLYVLEQAWGITPYIGKLIVGAFMTFWIYLGNKYWVFKGPRIGPIRL